MGHQVSKIAGFFFVIPVHCSYSTFPEKRAVNRPINPCFFPFWFYGFVNLTGLHFCSIKRWKYGLVFVHSDTCHLLLTSWMKTFIQLCNCVSMTMNVKCFMFPDIWQQPCHLFLRLFRTLSLSCLLRHLHGWHYQLIFELGGNHAKGYTGLPPPAFPISFIGLIFCKKMTIVSLSSTWVTNSLLTGISSGFLDKKKL